MHCKQLARYQKVSNSELGTKQPAILFSHTKSTPATSYQSAVLFSHNKSAQTISHSQANTAKIMETKYFLEMDSVYQPIKARKLYRAVCQLFGIERAENKRSTRENKHLSPHVHSAQTLAQKTSANGRLKANRLTESSFLHQSKQVTLPSCQFTNVSKT